MGQPPPRLCYSFSQILASTRAFSATCRAHAAILTTYEQSDTSVQDLASIWARYGSACFQNVLAHAGKDRGDADGAAAAAAVLPDQPAAGLLPAHRQRHAGLALPAGRHPGGHNQACAPRVCRTAEGARGQAP